MSDGDLFLIPETPHPLRGDRLGRHVWHDPRSKKFRAVAKGAVLQATTKVWPRVSVFDQGTLGSCTGNALVGVAGTGPNKKRLTRYSERLAVQVYERATVLDPFQGSYPPDDTGSTGLSAAKACVEKGLASSYRWAFGVDELVHTVSALGPCAVGTNWLTGMDNPDEHGVVVAAGAVRGGHEYEVLGWHEDTQRFECVNSWGKLWGRRGRFFLSYADMAALLADGGDAVTLIA